MPEVPITTTGKIRGHLRGHVFETELPNGKLIVAHLPRRLADLTDCLSPGDHVVLEMTPYDFEKARIAGRADDE